MAAVVDTVACMSPKSSQVGKEQRMMDKQSLGEGKDTGGVYGKAIYEKKGHKMEASREGESGAESSWCVGGWFLVLKSCIGTGRRLIVD